MERTTTTTHLALATMLVSRGPVIDLAGLPRVTGIVNSVARVLPNSSHPLSPPPTHPLSPPPTHPLSPSPTPPLSPPSTHPLSPPPTHPLTSLQTPTTPPTLPLTLRPTHTTPSTPPLTPTHQTTKVVPTLTVPVVGTALPHIPSAISKASSIISSVTKEGSSLVSVVSSVASGLTKSKASSRTSTFTRTPTTIRSLPPARTSSKSIPSNTSPSSSTGLSSTSKASPSTPPSLSVVGPHISSLSTPHLPTPTSGHISPTVITSVPSSPIVIPTSVLHPSIVILSSSLRPSGLFTSVPRLPPRPTATVSHTPQNSPSPNTPNASPTAATTTGPSAPKNVATFSQSGILALSSDSNPSIPTSINSFIQPETTSWSPSKTTSGTPSVTALGSMMSSPTSGSMVSSPTSGSMVSSLASGSMVSSPTSGSMVSSLASGSMVSSPTSGSTSESTPKSITTTSRGGLNRPGMSGSRGGDYGPSTASPKSTHGGSNDSVSPGFFNNPARLVGTFTAVGVVVIAAAVGVLILLRFRRGPRRHAQRIPNVDPDEEREQRSGPMMQRSLQTSIHRSGISGESAMLSIEDFRGENPFANPPNPGGSRYQALGTSETARSSRNVMPHSGLPTSPVDPVDPYGWPVMTSEEGRNSLRAAVSPDPYSTDPDTRAAMGWILADGPTLESIGEDDDSDSLLTVGYGTRPIATETRL